MSDKHAPNKPTVILDPPVRVRTPNKLVRDKVIENLISEGRAFRAHQLQDRALVAALSDKLLEEAAELHRAVQDYCNASASQIKTAEATCAVADEVADVRTVVGNLVTTMSRLGVDEDLFTRRAQEKVNAKGSFSKGTFLEWFEWNDDPEDDQ